jgi:hypothetical protein
VRLPVSGQAQLAVRPQHDQLRYGFGDRAIPCYPPSDGAWVDLQSAGRLHLPYAEALELSLEL